MPDQEPEQSPRFETTISPETELIPAELHARFLQIVEAVTPLILDAGFDSFLLSVHHHSANYYSSGIMAGSKLEVAGLVNDALRVGRERIRDLERKGEGHG